MYRTEVFILLTPQLPKKTILKHTFTGRNKQFPVDISIFIRGFIISRILVSSVVAMLAGNVIVPCLLVTIAN